MGRLPIVAGIFLLFGLASGAPCTAYSSKAGCSSPLHGVLNRPGSFARPSPNLIHTIAHKPTAVGKAKNQKSKSGKSTISSATSFIKLSSTLHSKAKVAGLPACGPIQPASSGQPSTRKTLSTYAFLGDFGITDGACLPKVVQLVHDLESEFGQPASILPAAHSSPSQHMLDFLVSLGDSNYWSGNCGTFQQNVDQYFSYYYPQSNITCVDPSNADNAGRAHKQLEAERDRILADGLSGSERFFPTIGNHDWDKWARFPAQLPYLQHWPYLASFPPGTSASQGQYYTTFPHPDLQLFSLNSNIGTPSASAEAMGIFQAQTEWIQHALSQSTAKYKLVFFHHPAHSTAQHDALATWMDLPFEQWGASAVLSGHQHDYERIVLPNTTMPFIVNGLGGHPWLYEVHNCDVYPGSKIRYNSYHGVLLGVLSSSMFDPNELQMDMCFYSLENGGTLVDHWQL